MQVIITSVIVLSTKYTEYTTNKYHIQYALTCANFL